MFPLAFAIVLTAAQAEDRSVVTEWVPEALAVEGQEIEVRRDRPFLAAQVMPAELVSPDAPVVSEAAGGEIMPAGTKLLRLRTRSTPVYCTVHGRPRWGALRRTIRVHVCLVDNDADGRFDSYYDERADHAALPLFRGTYPEQRVPIDPLPFTRLPSTEFIREFESLGIGRDARMSVFLKWEGSGIRCFFGMPRYRIMQERLTAYTVLPAQDQWPASAEVCGARLTVISREGGLLRLRVDRTYPVRPVPFLLRWQLF